MPTLLRHRMLPLYLCALGALGAPGCDDRWPLATAAVPPPHAAPPTPPPPAPPTADDLPDYLPQPNLAGPLTLAADPASRPLAERWARRLGDLQPELRVTLQYLRPGAAHACARAAQGSIALLAARLDGNEQDRCALHWGQRPAELAAAFDPLVVIAHPRNPITHSGVPLGQLSRIYTARDAVAWGDLRLGRDWWNRAIERLAYLDGSTLTDYFRRAILGGAALAPQVTRHSGPDTLLAAVAESPTALGFTTYRVASRSKAVVPVPLAAPGSKPVLPDPAAVYDGTYPTPRPSYLYLAPGPLADGQRALVRFVASRDAQTIAADLGYLPLSPELAQTARDGAQ